MERKGGKRAGGSGLIEGSGHVSLRILPTFMLWIISHVSNSALKSSNTFGFSCSCFFVRFNDSRYDMDRSGFLYWHTNIPII